MKGCERIIRKVSLRTSIGRVVQTGRVEKFCGDRNRATANEMLGTDCETMASELIASNQRRSNRQKMSQACRYIAARGNDSERAPHDRTDQNPGAKPAAAVLL